MCVRMFVFGLCLSLYVVFLLFSTIVSLLIISPHTQIRTLHTTTPIILLPFTLAHPNSHH